MRDSRRNVLLLALCQALFMSCGSLMIAVSPLVGVLLAPRAELATVPIGLMFLAVMCSTLPASLLMRRIGRRNGLVVGGLIGCLGGALAALGVWKGSFSLFTLGLVCMGVFNASSQYFRFAAADTAEDAFKARAISLVLAGGVIAAFVGPNLARLTHDAVPGVAFVGGFICVSILALACAGVVSGVRIPREREQVLDGPTRPMLRIAMTPRYLVAIVAATVAYGTMNLLMTATPLAMRVYGYDFGATASVIQWHVLGMFAPSFFTGRLIQRFGTLRVMLTGVLLLLCCIGVNLAGTSFAHFWTALALLGLGWNFLFIGATTLVTDTYTAAEKAKAQGTNDLLVFSMVAVTATSAGVLHEVIGWETINLYAVPGLIVVSLACLGLAWSDSRRTRLA